MTSKNEPPSKGVEGRFHDLSADVREERLVRYIAHQVQSGRHVGDIIKDTYVVQHFDEVARSRILEHPAVIKAIEESVRRQFAGIGDPGRDAKRGEGDEDSAERSSDADVSDL